MSGSDTDESIQFPDVDNAASDSDDSSDSSSPATPKPNIDNSSSSDDDNDDKVPEDSPRKIPDNTSQIKNTTQDSDSSDDNDPQSSDKASKQKTDNTAKESSDSESDSDDSDSDNNSDTKDVANKNQSSDSEDDAKSVDKMKQDSSDSESDNPVNGKSQDSSDSEADDKTTDINPTEVQSGVPIDMEDTPSSPQTTPQSPIPEPALKKIKIISDNESEASETIQEQTVITSDESSDEPDDAKDQPDSSDSDSPAKKQSSSSSSSDSDTPPKKKKKKVDLDSGSSSSDSDSAKKKPALDSDSSSSGSDTKTGKKKSALDSDSSSSDSDTQTKKKKQAIDSDSSSSGSDTSSTRIKKLKKKKVKSSDESSSSDDDDSDVSRDSAGRKQRKKKKKFIPGSDDDSKKSSSGSEAADPVNLQISDSDEDGKASESTADTNTVLNKPGEPPAGEEKAGSDDDPFDRPTEQGASYQDNTTSDFDKLMNSKKDRMKTRRRRGNTADSSFLSDADDIINDLMRKMAEASGQDKDDCLEMKPTFMKLKLLPEVEKHFLIKDYQESFIENGVMTAIADWLTPLPSGALPSLKIRTFLLKTLSDFPPCSTETLKASGIGKAINRLSLHVKELKDNKKVCRALIRSYSKQIFGISELSQGFSREERQQRDMDTLNKYGMTKQSEYQLSRDKASKEAALLRAGEKGFFPRARVPQISNRDYLIRPKHNIDPDEIGPVKKTKTERTGNEKKVFELQRKKVNAKVNLKIKRGAALNLSGAKML